MEDEHDVDIGDYDMEDWCFLTLDEKDKFSSTSSLDFSWISEVSDNEDVLEGTPNNEDVLEITSKNEEIEASPLDLISVADFDHFSEECATEIEEFGEDDSFCTLNPELNLSEGEIEDTAATAAELQCGPEVIDHMMNDLVEEYEEEESISVWDFGQFPYGCYAQYLYASEYDAQPLIHSKRKKTDFFGNRLRRRYSQRRNKNNYSGKYRCFMYS